MLKTELNRRDVLKLAAGALLLPNCGGKDEYIEVCGSSVSDPLDTVLDALHAMDPEWAGGSSNHGPMAAEALLRLGRGDWICDWMGHYFPNLEPLPKAQPIALADQSEALGDARRRAAWIETYLERVDADLEGTLASAWSSLLPGIAAAGFHGPLRVGHALRALAQADTPPRRRELAHGLGYWAARHFPLPGSVGATPRAGLDVVQALDELSIVPNARTGGLIYDRVAQVKGFQPFVDEVAQVDLDVWPVEQTITELAAAVARLYIAAPRRDNIGYLHAFDGASLLRPMLPWMDATTQRTAIGYLYQAVAALHATHARAPGVPQGDYDAGDPARLAQRGAEADDEHSLKFVEALIAEHALDPRPEFLAAAQIKLA